MAKKALRVQVEELREENVKLKRAMEMKDARMKEALEEISSAVDAILKTVTMKFGDIEGNEEEKTYRIRVPYPKVGAEKPKVARDDDGYEISVIFLE